MTDPNNELREFIRESLRQIKEGADGHTISDSIHFRVAVAKSISGEGKVGLIVLGVGAEGKGDISHDVASEIGFSIKIHDSELGGVNRK